MSETEILGLARHPASAVWPDLGAEEYAALRDNINAQGQDHPILVTPDKQVIDGWHRLRACAEIDVKPVTVTAHFSDEEIAKKVIGAHTGRRHMTKIEIARLSVATMEACGMEFAGKGDRRSPEQTAQQEPSAPTITRETVARDANVSEATARRAIAERKRDRGLLPPRPRPAPAKQEQAAAEPDRTSGDEGASTPPEAPSNGAEAPSSPANGADETETAAQAPASEAGAEQTDAVAGEPDPGPLDAIRRALAQMQDFDPADVVAELDAEQIGEFYDLGQAAVDVGFAMVRAAGPHRSQPAAAPEAVPGKPAAEDGVPDIPQFLDRRSAG